MKKPRLSFHHAAAFLALLAFPTLPAASAREPATKAAAHEHRFLSPRDLKWTDAGSGLPKGSKIAVLEGNPSKKGPFTLRIKFPAGAKIMPHWHPADEHATVLSGVLRMGMGDHFDEKKTTPLGPGGFSLMPAKMHHFGWVKVDTEIQLHGLGPWAIIYVNPKDDPRNQHAAAR